MICFFKGHKLKHIANWTDVKGGRGLWQCERCKLVHIDASSMFYDERHRRDSNNSRTPTI